MSKATLLLSVIAAVVVVVVGVYLFTSRHHKDLLVFQVVQEEVIFNAANIKNAEVVNQGGNAISLKVELTPAAAEEFARATKAGIGKNSNLIFNGRIVSSAKIQSQLGGEFIVTGLTKEEAEEILHSIKKSQ